MKAKKDCGFIVKEKIVTAFSVGKLSAINFQFRYSVMDNDEIEVGVYEREMCKQGTIIYYGYIIN